jgi:hypothetical protein
MDARTILPARLALLTMALAACQGDGDAAPSGVPPSSVLGTTPPAGAIRFAFKAGHDAREQIWLWLEDGRLHHLSTWVPDDPGVRAVQPSFGYEEGSGRFGRLHFDHQRRFLIATEKIMVDRPRNLRPGWRLVSYELATGRVAFTPLQPVLPEMLAPGDDPLVDTTPEIAITASTTLVIVPRREEREPWLYTFDGGVLAPAPGAEVVPSPPTSWSTSGDLDGTTVLATDGNLLWRRQGRWSSFPVPSCNAVEVLASSPAGDALCLGGSGPSGVSPWLLTSDGHLRRLPCTGSVSRCAFSPDGELAYLAGCQEPLVYRDGRSRAGPALRLFNQAHVRSGGGWMTLASSAAAWAGRDAGQLYLFDWTTQEHRLLRNVGPDAFPRCVVFDMQTARDGTGLALVKTHCGCIDCDNGYFFAVDLATESMRRIDDREHGVAGGSALLGSAAVTTIAYPDLTLAPEAGASLLYWTDADGPRLMGPLPGVTGGLHDPVRF